MTTSRAIFFAACCAIACASFGARPASAQVPKRAPPTEEQRAAAQVLFEEGRTLMNKKLWKRACPKFAESMRLDPAIGTQLNLARCYEETGKLASAWINWVEAAQRAEAAGQTARVDIAQKRAAALEPRIGHLTIVVASPVKGLRVSRDDARVGKAQWGTRLPIDPGVHVISASAPGHQRWSQEVDLRREGRDLTVEVPALVPEAVEDGLGAQLIAGIAVTAVGAVGVGLGIGFGLLAMGKNDDSLAECPDSPTLCSADGVKLRDEAFTAAHVSTVGFAVGGAALVAGVVLMLTAPSGAPDEGAEAHVFITPVPGGIGLGGRF